jgi:hypothetical protein
VISGDNSAIIKELEDSFLDTYRFIKLTPDDNQSLEEADTCPVAGTASFMINTSEVRKH